MANLDFPFNVIGLTETWLTKDNADLYEVDIYKHIYRCREDQVGWGVSLYLNPSLAYKEKGDIEKHFTLSAEAVIVETCQSIIACIYRPPSSSLSVFNVELANVLDIICKEGKKCYLMGDINIKKSKYQHHKL